MPITPAESTTITTYDGATLAVYTYGARDAEPLLLIAGQALAAAAWDPAVDGFAGRYRVITYDHRGTGDSEVRFPGEPTAWTTREAARDALAVLDGLGIARAHIYGHSMGGRIAQWLAVDAPDRVASLVLGGTSGGDSAGVPRREWVSAALAAGDLERLAPVFFGRDWLAAHPEDALVSARSPSEIARSAHFAASQGHDAWAALGTIDVPTLVVQSLDDQVCPPENARLLVNAIPTAELHLLDDGMHVYYAGGIEASESVLSFLRHHPMT